MLTAVAEAKVVIERARLLPKQELRLRRQAFIRMTHSSTSIEGNILNLSQVEAVAGRKKVDAPLRDVYEVENYLKTLRYITQMVEEKRLITAREIRKIHKLVTYRTLPQEQSGFYRSGPVYVVRRRSGMLSEVVYSAPNAKQVPRLVVNLVKWIQESKKQDINPILVAGLAHQEFALIHPFADGNGRTARALATLVLYQRGYDFRRLFALEDYYNKNRAKYYAAIARGSNYEKRLKDSTSWLEYFVRGFKEEIDNVKTQVLALSLKKVRKELASQVYLDQNQLRILDFLEQVGRITVNDAMEILGCPRRTAQLQLQRLKKLEMIQQTGKGPSAAYIAAS